MDWTDPANSEWLRALWGENPALPTAEIGRRMGITKNSVVSRAHRLHLPARPSPIIRTGERTPRKKSAPRQTLPPAKRPVVLAPPPEPPEPAVSSLAWRHPDGCQYHLRREGIQHVFCCEAIGKEGGPYCDAHRARCYAPRALLNAA